MLTFPAAYTRRFYKEKEEEIVISCCNYCLAVVAESDDEAELERLEQQHRCGEGVKAFAA